MSVTPLPRAPEEEQGERHPRRSPPPAPGRAPSLIDSFNYAFEGIIHVLRTQRNLRIHFLAAGLVFAGAIAVGASRLQLIALVLAIAFVLVAEMLNAAIEGVIDASTTSFDPNAKLAKDIAAGAVLIASITAVAVGYLVFESAAGSRATHVRDRVRKGPADITLVALVLVVLLVIATKAWTGRGTPLRGRVSPGLTCATAFPGIGPRSRSRSCASRTLGGRPCVPCSRAPTRPRATCRRGPSSSPTRRSASTSIRESGGRCSTTRCLRSNGSRGP